MISCRERALVGARRSTHEDDSSAGIDSRTMRGSILLHINSSLVNQEPRDANAVELSPRTFILVAERNDQPKGI